jgi:rubrerythrin
MTTRDAAIVALADAVKFESDGCDFYQRAAERVGNPLAKSIFLALADDEKDHIRRVREIYEQLKDKPGWPEVGAMVARHSGVVDAYERAAADLKGSVTPDGDAEEALRTAADLECQGLAFYRDRLAKASCDAEAEFFRTLVGEEELHLKSIEGVLRQMGG